jgi:hypothetical protein
MATDLDRWFSVYGGICSNDSTGRTCVVEAGGRGVSPFRFLASRFGLESATMTTIIDIATMYPPEGTAWVVLHHSDSRPLEAWLAQMGKQLSGIPEQVYRDPGGCYWAVIELEAEDETETT